MPFESYSDALRWAEDAIDAGRRSFWVAVNPEKVYTAGRDARLREALSQADVGLCDGVGVAIAARLLHGRTVRRCTGCDLFFQLIAKAAEKGWKVYLLGASPESNAGACARLLEQHPGLKIAGHRDGYFEDAAEAIAEINASGAQLLFVAMGSPKQELWIAEHRQAIRAPFCMGVGGSFDVASGRAPRAPRFFQRTGTEYLFQLFFRPGWGVRRRWRRTMARLAFMARVLREALRRRVRGA